MRLFKSSIYSCRCDDSAWHGAGGFRGRALRARAIGGRGRGCAASAREVRLPSEDASAALRYRKMLGMGIPFCLVHLVWWSQMSARQSFPPFFELVTNVGS